MKSWLAAFVLAVCGLAQIPALAQAAASAPPPAAAAPQRLRGTVESFDGALLVVKERSGETVKLVLGDKFMVSEVVKIDLAAVQAGSFVGAAAVPGPDGTLRATEVMLFPEEARGTGEGHRDWDLQPGGTMTNATVAEVAAAPDGRTLKLRYPGGEQTLMVPSEAPVVTLKPGDTGLLVPGAKVFVIAQLRGDQPTALRVLAGRDGFAPPM